MTIDNNEVSCNSKLLADKLLQDLKFYGDENMSAESIVVFHYSMIDFFSEEIKNKIIRAYMQSFSLEYDWTLNCPFEEQTYIESWMRAFGVPEKRIIKGHIWANTLDIYHLCAAAVITSVLGSANIPYIYSNIEPNCRVDVLENLFSIKPEVNRSSLNRYFSNYLFYSELARDEIATHYS
jgi:hypothetical protein